MKKPYTKTIEVEHLRESVAEIDIWEHSGYIQCEKDDLKMNTQITFKDRDKITKTVYFKYSNHLT